MFEWLIQHSGEIAGVILAVMAAAQAIVNLTPTPKDDEIFGVIYKWVERIAGIWSDTAKEHPGEREKQDEAIIEAIKSQGREEGYQKAQAEASMMKIATVDAEHL